MFIHVGNRQNQAILASILYMIQWVYIAVANATICGKKKNTNMLSNNSYNIVFTCIFKKKHLKKPESQKNPLF